MAVSPDGASLSRRLQDVAAASLGRSSLRFHFELVPQRAVGLPAGVAAASAVFEKGSKISFTDAAEVVDGAAEWAQVIRQTATVYKAGSKLLPKEYAWKLQAVAAAKPGAPPSRKTIARARLDLAPFCAASTTPACSEGTLYLSVRAVWLQHYSPSKASAAASSDADSATETSSHGGSSLHDVGEPAQHVSSADLADLLSQRQQAPHAASSPVRSPQQLQVAASLAAAQTAHWAAPAPPTPDGGVRWGAGGGTASCRHKRAVSMPGILEADREGSFEQRRPEERLQAQEDAALAAAAASVERQQAGAASASNSSSSGGSDGSEPEAAPRGLSGSAARFLWPFGARGEAQGSTSEQLLRSISATSEPAQLRSLARGLLAERNDWRQRATQAEGTRASLVEQVRQLQASDAELQAQLRASQASQRQLQGDALLDKLVNAKLALAQSASEAEALRLQLAKERERSRGLAARLTRLQSAHDVLLDQQQQRRQREQGEGLGAAPGAASRGSSASEGSQGQGPGQGLVARIASGSAAWWAGQGRGGPQPRHSIA